MKKINKFLFLAILLSLVLSNCQKKEEKSTNTQNKKVENVSNQDVLREISLDEMLDFEHIPKRIGRKNSEKLLKICLVMVTMLLK